MDSCQNLICATPPLLTDKNIYKYCLKNISFFLLQCNFWIFLWYTVFNWFTILFTNHQCSVQHLIGQSLNLIVRIMLNVITCFNQWRCALQGCIYFLYCTQRHWLKHLMTFNITLTIKLKHWPTKCWTEHCRFMNSIGLEVGYRWLFLGNFFESKRTPNFFKILMWEDEKKKEKRFSKKFNVRWAVKVEKSRFLKKNYYFFYKILNFYPNYKNIIPN